MGLVCSKHMRRTKFYSYILAALLNAAPFFRSISTSSALLSTPFAIVMRWAFGAAAVAGSFHGASAASTVTITPTSATGTNGVSMAVRFVVKYSVTEGGHTTTLIAQSYRASGLPPGLSMTAQGLTGGTVTGKPASSGQFTATIIGYQSPNFQDNQSPPMPVVFNIISSSSPAHCDRQSHQFHSVRRFAACVDCDPWRRRAFHLPMAPGRSRSQQCHEQHPGIRSHSTLGCGIVSGPGEQFRRNRF